MGPHGWMAVASAICYLVTSACLHRLGRALRQLQIASGQWTPAVAPAQASLERRRPPPPTAGVIGGPPTFQPPWVVLARASRGRCRCLPQLPNARRELEPSVGCPPPGLQAWASPGRRRHLPEPGAAPLSSLGPSVGCPSAAVVALARLGDCGRLWPSAAELGPPGGPPAWAKPGNCRERRPQLLEAQVRLELVPSTACRAPPAQVVARLGDCRSHRRPPADEKPPELQSSAAPGPRAALVATRLGCCWTLRR